MSGGNRHSRTFLALYVTDFLLWIEWGIARSMLPIHVHELGASPLDVGLVFTVFSIILIFIYPFWGAVSSHFGKRKILIVFGMATTAPLFLIMAFQNQVLQLILLRACTAISIGAVVPTTWTLVSDVSSPQRVGRNMGVLGSVELAGAAFGPLIGGVVADTFGFPALWIFVAAVCVVGAVVFLIGGSDPPSVKREARGVFLESFRIRGMVPGVYVVCVSFAVFLVGIALLGPNMNVYLYDELGFSRTMVGILSFVGTGVAMLVQPIGGSYSDRYGRKQLLIVGALSLSVGNALLFISRDPYMVAAAQILIGCSRIFQFMGPAYITDVVSQRKASYAIGLFRAVDSVTWSLAPTVGGYAIAETGFSIVFLISALFPILSIAIVLILLKETASVEKPIQNADR
jgi:MFS family permease